MAGQRKYCWWDCSSSVNRSLFKTKSSGKQKYFVGLLSEVCSFTFWRHFFIRHVLIFKQSFIYLLIIFFTLPVCCLYQLILTLLLGLIPSLTVQEFQGQCNLVLLYVHWFMKILNVLGSMHHLSINSVSRWVPVLERF